MSVALGQEWVIDLHGCDPAALRDVQPLQALFDELVQTLGLQVIGAPQWHAFPGAGGVTGLALLSESHLAIHTFPEHGYAALSVYSCRPRPAPDFEAVGGRHLHAAQVRVRAFNREAVPPLSAVAG